MPMFVRTYLEGYLIRPKKTYKMQPIKIDEKWQQVYFYLIRGFYTTGKSAGKPYYQAEYDLYGAGVNGHLGKKWLDEDAIINIEYPETTKEMLLEAIEKHQFLGFILNENYYLEKLWIECLF